METPFVFGKIATEKNFTDREQETAYLVKHFTSLINTIIISPRRWGKSSLVNKAAELAIMNEQQQAAYIQKLEQAAKKIIASNDHLELLGNPEHHLPGVISLVVNQDDFDNERFVKRVSEKFAISTGSACTAGMPSHVLQAIGKGDAVSRVLRISLSAENTIDQVEAFLKELS